MFKRIFVSLTLSVTCALLLTGCGSSETPTTNGSNATSTNQTSSTTTTTTSTPAATTTTSTPATTTTTTTSTGDKVGVPECDDFIAKYEACVTSKVPAEARAQFNASLKQWRDTWRQAASTPQGKASLTQGCKMIAEQSKQTMKPYGCDF